MASSDRCFENALKMTADASKLLDTVMYSMGDGLSIQDRNMRIVYQNKFMIDHFGPHVGERCYKIYEKRDAICEGCPIVEAFRTGNVTKALRVGVVEGGTSFRFENIASPLRNEQGEIVAGMELCRIVEDREKAFDDLRAAMEELRQTKDQLVRDIAERKLLEASLKETKNRLAVVINTIPDLIWLKDPDGVYLACNKEFELLYGAEEKVILGKTDYDFISRELADFFRRTDREAIAAGRLSINEEKVVYASDGRQAILETRRVPLLDAAGGVLGVLGIGRDITKFKLLQSQLLQSQKLESIGLLAAGIAHEINTPAQYVSSNLNFIQNSIKNLLELTKVCALIALPAKEEESQNTRMALRELFERDDFEFLTKELLDALSDSLEGLDRISQIVQSVKQFAHPGTDSREYLDLNECVTSSVTVSTNEWKHVAELEMDLDGSLSLIPGFRADLYQVILNLIINATHSIHEKLGSNPIEKGRITVSTNKLSDVAQILISDTGMGIPISIRGKVFDPFFTTKEVGKGSGLGLSICFGIIHEKHGGTISFESEEGQGTTFTVTLPLEIPGE